MKACPFCAEQIQDAAKKCRFCGEWLEADPRTVEPGFGVPVTVPAPSGGLPLASMPPPFGIRPVSAPVSEATGMAPNGPDAPIQLTATIPGESLESGQPERLSPEDEAARSANPPHGPQGYSGYVAQPQHLTTPRPGAVMPQGYPPMGGTPYPGYHPQSVYQPMAFRQVAVTPYGAHCAGWWIRVAALLLDVLVTAVPFIVIDLITGAIFQGTGTDPGVSGWIIVVLDVILFGIYVSVFTAVGNGQTVGNIATGIAVRDVNTGAKLGFGRSLLRFTIRSLMYVFLLVPGALNDLWPLWDPMNQSIADNACRTVVVRLR